MRFFGRNIDVLPSLVLYLVGAALGRNLCHHAGWPWWIGFTIVPALFVLAGVLVNRIFRKVASRSTGKRPGPPP